MNNDALVTLIEDDKPVWTGSFADFCASNKFEDDEISHIEDDLDVFGVFEGGGGALAGFRVIVAGGAK